MGRDGLEPKISVLLVFNMDKASLKDHLAVDSVSVDKDLLKLSTTNVHTKIIKKDFPR